MLAWCEYEDFESSRVLTPLKVLCRTNIHSRITTRQPGDSSLTDRPTAHRESTTDERDSYAAVTPGRPGRGSQAPSGLDPRRQYSLYLQQIQLPSQEDADPSSHVAAMQQQNEFCPSQVVLLEALQGPFGASVAVAPYR